jgi:hypothetical protein
MFTTCEYKNEDIKVNEAFKEEILNCIREEIDLGFEDWKPELKKFIKKTIRKELKKILKEKNCG